MRSNKDFKKDLSCYIIRCSCCNSSVEFHLFLLRSSFMMRCDHEEFKFSWRDFEGFNPVFRWMANRLDFLHFFTLSLSSARAARKSAWMREKGQAMTNGKMAVIIIGLITPRDLANWNSQQSLLLWQTTTMMLRCEWCAESVEEIELRVGRSSRSLLYVQFDHASLGKSSGPLLLYYTLGSSFF